MQTFASASKKDYEIAEEALELMGVGYLKDEAYRDQRRRTPVGTHRQSHRTGIGLSDYGRAYVKSGFWEPGPGAAPRQTVGGGGKGGHYDDSRSGSCLCGIL